MQLDLFRKYQFRSIFISILLKRHVITIKVFKYIITEILWIGNFWSEPTVTNFTLTLRRSKCNKQHTYSVGHKNQKRATNFSSKLWGKTMKSHTFEWEKYEHCEYIVNCHSLFALVYFASTIRFGFFIHKTLKKFPSSWFSFLFFFVLFLMICLKYYLLFPPISFYFFFRLNYYKLCVLYVCALLLLFFLFFWILYYGRLRVLFLAIVFIQLKM